MSDAGEQDTSGGSNPVELDPSFLNAAEQRMRESFMGDVGREVELVDIACALLVHALSRVGGRSVTIEVGEAGEFLRAPDPNEVILGACTLIGTRALGVIRAARAVLASGFEGEARALDRILVELLAHRRAILNDQTGEEAVAWMRRERTRGISKRVAAMGEPELYANLSTDSHGDPAPLLRLMDLDDKSIDMAPRRTAATGASLLMYAGFARDQAVLLAKLSGAVEITGIEELDSAMNNAWDQLGADASEEGTTTEAPPEST
jgi:hypothetical protein